MKIALAVKNQGHVPSFKTLKQASINQQTGKPFVRTPANVKAWMLRCIANFESQLFLDTQITGPETPTAPNQPSWIASLLPLDDSWQWIPEQHIYCEKVEKGKEGAIIIIEKI
jgi:hypothetical protein